MTLVLTVCACLSAVIVLIAIALLFAPITPAELALWRRLRTQALRKWITRRRHVDEPLDRVSTPQIARRNLLWHLVLTVVFSTQLARAAASPQLWWRPLAPLFMLPSVAYFAGSIVQRQKLAVLHLRSAVTRRDAPPCRMKLASHVCASQSTSGRRRDFAPSPGRSPRRRTQADRSSRGRCSVAAGE